MTHRVKVTFTDNSNNEQGFDFNSSDNSIVVGGFTIESFEYDGETFTRYRTDTGSAYGQRHGNGFWNGQYIGIGSSTYRQKTFRFSIYNTNDPNDFAGAWILEEALNIQNTLTYSTEQENVGGKFSDLWNGYMKQTVSNIQITDPNEELLGNLTNNGEEYIETNLKHLSTNSTNRILTGENFSVHAESKRGNKLFNVKAVNPSGSADPQEFPRTEVYDRSDVILYIGDANAQGLATISDLSAYEGYNVANLSLENEEPLAMDIDSSATPYVASAWSSIDPSSLTTMGMEISFLDYLAKRKIRHTSLITLGVNGATFSGSLASNGTAYTYLNNNLLDLVEDLWDEHCQPRIRAVILNMGYDDNVATIEADIEDFKSRIRTLCSYPDMPIILTKQPSENLNDHAITALFGLIEEADPFTYTVDASQFSVSAGKAYDEAGMVDLGLAYAKTIKPILQGELDPLDYDPAVYFNPSNPDEPQTGAVSLIKNYGSFSDFVPTNATNVAEAGFYINDIPVWDFNKTDDYTPVSGDSPFGAIGTSVLESTFIWVMQVQTNTAGYIWLMGGTASNNTRYLIHAPWTNGHLYFYDGDMNSVSNGEALPIGQPVICSCVSSDTEGIKEVRINGLTKNSKTNNVGKIGSKIKFNGFNEYGQDALLGEMLVFNHHIGLDNRRKIEGYLSHKYSIQLDSSHPYYSNPPTS